MGKLPSVDKGITVKDSKGKDWYLDRQEVTTSSFIEPGGQPTETVVNVFAFNENQRVEHKEEDLKNRKAQLEQEISSRQAELVDVNDKLDAIGKLKGTLKL